MVALILFLLGISFYGGKYAISAVNNSSYNARMSEINSYQQFLQHRAVIPSESKKLKSYIVSGAYFQKICDILKDDLQYVYGNNYRDLIRIPPRQQENPYISDDEFSLFLYPDNDTYWVYHLLLSHIGRIDGRILVDHGYSPGSLPNLKRNIKFARRIEHNLHRHGSQIQFVIPPYYQYNKHTHQYDRLVYPDRIGIKWLNSDSRCIEIKSLLESGEIDQLVQKHENLCSYLF